MEKEEREELVEQIADALADRGLPAGTWLVDIAEVRSALQSADALLRRLQDAITQAATESRRRGP